MNTIMFLNVVLLLLDYVNCCLCVGMCNCAVNQNRFGFQILISRTEANLRGQTQSLVIDLPWPRSFYIALGHVNPIGNYYYYRA